MEFEIIEIDASEGGKQITLALDGSFTIYTVRDAQALLSQALARAGVILNLDLAGVSEIDSAGMQLLIHLARQARLGSKKLVLREHSAPVLHIMDIYGLFAFFANPVRISEKERDRYVLGYGLKRKENPALYAKVNGNTGYQEPEKRGGEAG